MSKIDLNKLAKRICELEGGKQNLSIAQVMEVQKHTLDQLALALVKNPSGFMELWQRRLRLIGE